MANDRWVSNVATWPRFNHEIVFALNTDCESGVYYDIVLKFGILITFSLSNFESGIATL